MSTSLPALGLADKIGEQDNKLEIVVCCFTKVGGHKIPRIKV